MEDITKVKIQTPIEIALGIDENGMTTVKKLFDFLGMSKANYARWYKTNITDNQFAEENVDYFPFAINGECAEIENARSSLMMNGKYQPNPTQDAKITAHFAKKLSMMQKNERGEEAREYFSHVEEKTKELAVNRAQLPQSMQIIYAMLDEQARVTLEQKRQAEQISRLEENQKAITTAMAGQKEEDFKHWVSRCLSAIAESPNYQYIGSREERHKAVRAESYERLNQKRPCRLNQRVESEKGRAAIAGASQKRINSINKLTIIETDKSLKPVYESVVKEMLIAYCVEVA